MKNFSLVLKMGLLSATSVIVCSCGSLRPNAGPIAIPDIVTQNKGKVIVALLGMEGCPGTEAATPFLAEYSKSGQNGVVVYRVDVPVRGKSLAKAKDIDPAINYVVDNKRAIADWVEFFFYPTLYIIDNNGAVRFSGGCEPEKVKTMVAEILRESPDAEKKMYTPPLARVGAVIPDFKINDIDNKETSLGAVCKDKGAILLFSATTCPFSVNALGDFEKLKKKHKDKINFALVALGQDAATVRDVYSTKSPGSIVLIDSDKSASLKNFSVSAVPFFYVLNKDRKVVERRPFVYDMANAAISTALGKSSGGGCGGATGAG